LDELQLILEAMREREHRQMKFAASLKGIDLDKYQTEDNQARVQRIKDKVAARQRGEDPEKFELTEHFDHDYEVEE
jgi:hypothetical protein